MALDENGRPSDAALLNAMKRDMDEQVSRLNDNRIFLIAVVDELNAENLALKSQLEAYREADAAALSDTQNT